MNSRTASCGRTTSGERVRSAPLVYQSTRRMIGRVSARRSTSVNPAWRNADASPVQAKAAGRFGCFG